MPFWHRHSVRQLLGLQDQKCSPDDIKSQAEPANRSSRMEVLLVRSVEKALDAVNGRLKHTSWNAVLTRNDGLRVLQVASTPL